MLHPGLCGKGSSTVYTHTSSPELLGLHGLERDAVKHERLVKHRIEVLVDGLRLKTML